MNRTEAEEVIKGHLREYVENITERDAHAGRNQYKCPLCGSGKRGTRDSDGAFTIHENTNSWYCYSCQKGGSIIDLMKEFEHIDTGEAFRLARDRYGIRIDDDSTSSAPAKVEQPTEPEEDLTEEFRKWAKQIESTDYLQRRGISKAIQERFWIGYRPDFREGTGGTSWKVIVFPTSQSTYNARNTDTNATSNNRYRKHGHGNLFNRRGLYEATKPIFVVEGEIDALSILEVGGEAVALGSTTFKDKFIRIVSEKRPNQPLILALDADDNGHETEDYIANRLQSLGLSFYRHNVFNGEKDANAALMKNRETFTAQVQEAYRIVEAEEQKEYAELSVSNHLQEFIDGIGASADTPAIPTGFSNLDAELDGGLYEGLYILGAVSSLGKTSLVLQIADQIAQSGRDVLIFSLEMARTELMAKSISRHTFIDVTENGGNLMDAKTVRGVTDGSRYARYSQREIDIIKRATTTYSTYTDHLFICQTEGIEDRTLQDIENISRELKDRRQEAPVIVVDYLQIIAPPDARGTDKQNADKIVRGLKRISRDLKTPVVAISSFNRENYNKGVNMTSFKESGGLEYAADILLGLQYKGVEDSNFDADKARQADPREIELKILKNRNGATGKTIVYDYYPKFNFFEEK